MRWPGQETRDRWEFIFKGVQAAAIVFGAIWALWTFTTASWQHQADVKRELQRPYDEKQLNLYLEAARVTARLGKYRDVADNATEIRFWELYWGELAFVESKEVRSMMVKFCQKRFGNGCGDSPDDKNPPDDLLKAAITLSTKASEEVQRRWLRPGK